MTDVIDTLKSYLDDPTVVMSRRAVNDTIAEIERLRAERDALHAELAAAQEKLDAYDMDGAAAAMAVKSAEEERDALRANLRDELERADAWHKTFLETQKHNEELRTERDAAYEQCAKQAEIKMRKRNLREADIQAVVNSIRALLNKGGSDD